MQKRYSDFISLLKAHNKMSSIYCDIVVNKMGIETLRLLREHGLIQGFSLVTSHKRKLYPRATVYLKFAHRYSPIISDIRLFKNTARNFTTVRYLKKRGIYNPRKFYLITNVRGLELVSLSTLLQNNTVYGRVLAEFSV